MTLIEFYIQQTGKKADEITILEYEALSLSLDYFRGKINEELLEMKKETVLA
jgi:hypothetical protein